MTKEQSFVFADHIDRDPFTSSRTQERALNAAIVQANISESFEEYIEIFDAFYDDDIQITSETGEEPIRGKARVSSLLANFLVPLHCLGDTHERKRRWSWAEKERAWWRREGERPFLLVRV